MQSGKDEVTGLRSLERNFSCFKVAHFSNQNYLGRLTQALHAKRKESLWCPVQLRVG